MVVGPGEEPRRPLRCSPSRRSPIGSTAILRARSNQTSAFGAFLDPVADKLMVAAALILLVGLGRVDAPIAVIIIGREIAISALREWMAKIGKSRSVAVNFLGKVKTASQMAAILLLLYHGVLFGLLDTREARHVLDLHRRRAHPVVDGLLSEDRHAAVAWQIRLSAVFAGLPDDGVGYLDTSAWLPIIPIRFSRE